MQPGEIDDARQITLEARLADAQALLSGRDIAACADLLAGLRVLRPVGGDLFGSIEPELRERLAIVSLRTAWRHHAADADAAWNLLEGLEGALPKRLRGEWLDARKLCARQRAKRLETINALHGTDWPQVILWRQRMRELAPQHINNQVRLVEALLYSQQDAEAAAVIAAADPQTQSAMAEALGDIARVLPALRDSDAKVYAQAAPAYLRARLPVIPAFGKIALHAGWRDYQAVLPPADTVAEWSRIGAAQIALVLGPAAGISILEIDARAPALAALIMRAAPHSPWRRRGRYGEARAYRGSTTDKVYVETPDGVTAFETRVDGEMLMLPPSIHSGTGAAYRANVHLADVLDDLPVLPAGFADAIMAEAASAGHMLIRRP